MSLQGTAGFTSSCSHFPQSPLHSLRSSYTSPILDVRPNIHMPIFQALKPAVIQHSFEHELLFILLPLPCITS